MKEPDYLESLAEIVSRSNQLEHVHISRCEMDGTMIKPIITALHTATHSMKTIKFEDTNWNSIEAIEELVKFIATAPELEWCSIAG